MSGPEARGPGRSFRLDARLLEDRLPLRDLRRELGAVVTAKAAVQLLRKVFESDWDLSHHYDAPDPLLSQEHVEDDFPHDPALEHE